jgi:hypothetical protein
MAVKLQTQNRASCIYLHYTDLAYFCYLKGLNRRPYYVGTNTLHISILIFILGLVRAQNRRQGQIVPPPYCLATKIVKCLPY